MTEVTGILGDLNKVNYLTKEPNNTATEKECDKCHTLFKLK